MALESDPSCARESEGIALCAAIGPGSKIFATRWNGTSWTAWFAPTGGVMTSAPSCTSAANNHVICAARNSGLQLTAFEETSNQYAPFISLGIGLRTAPSCTLLVVGVGKVLCAGPNSAGHLVGATYDGSGNWSSASWTKLAPVSAAAYSSVNCAPGGDATGEAICVWLTTANATVAELFNGTAWNGQVNIGGNASNPPVCTGEGNGGGSGVDCFTTGTNNELFVNAYDGIGLSLGDWSGYAPLGGEVGRFSCARFIQTGNVLNIACGVTALLDTGFDTDDYNAGWGGYTRQGSGTYIGNPSCFAINLGTPGRVMCVVTQPNGQAASIIGP
jgi:hypothetical protein